MTCPGLGKVGVMSLFAQLSMSTFLLGGLGTSFSAIQITFYPILCLAVIPA
jgi:hypothetical protein